MNSNNNAEQKMDKKIELHDAHVEAWDEHCFQQEQAAMKAAQEAWRSEFARSHDLPEDQASLATPWLHSLE
jgi:hypothetical protein